MKEETWGNLIYKVFESSGGSTSHPQLYERISSYPKEKATNWKEVLRATLQHDGRFEMISKGHWGIKKNN